MDPGAIIAAWVEIGAPNVACPSPRVRICERDQPDLPQKAFRADDNRSAVAEAPASHHRLHPLGSWVATFSPGLIRACLLLERQT